MKFEEIVDGLVEGRVYRGGSCSENQILALTYTDSGKPFSGSQLRKMELRKSFAKYNSVSIENTYDYINLMDLQATDWVEVDPNSFMDYGRDRIW